MSPHRQTDPAAEVAFRAICMAEADAIDAALVVFLETEDPAGPHKARVALRRLTTALDTFLPLLRRKATADLRARAKRLFRLLGRVRDSDVLVQSHSGKARQDMRFAQNLRLRQKTRATLRKDRAVGFPQLLRRAVQEGGTIYRQSLAAQDRRQSPVSQLAAGMLAEAWDRCLAYGASLTTLPEKRRHDFRKDMKTLRYLAEFFADLFPDLQGGDFRKTFRSIQDDLGLVNDYETALVLECRPRPARPPAAVAEALDRVERRWQRLSAATPPWADQAT